MLAALAERIWPGLDDLGTEPDCGWCGWQNGHGPEDVRPNWECWCAEHEANAGRRCARCGRVFTAEHPAVAVQLWGMGQPENIHAICRFEGDE